MSVTYVILWQSYVTRNGNARLGCELIAVFIVWAVAVISYKDTSYHTDHAACLMFDVGQWSYGSEHRCGVQCSPAQVYLKGAVSAVKGGLDLFQLLGFYWVFSLLCWFSPPPSLFPVFCNQLFLPVLFREDASALRANFSFSLRGDSRG